MRPFPVLALLALAAPALAQVNDVGLTMTGPTNTSVVGQACGPLACTLFNAGTLAPGAARTVTHHAALNSLYALAIGLPGPCLQFPGIANDVLLLLPPVTLAVGVTASPGLSTSACRQGQARYQFIVPAGAPSGVVFRLQSLGVSNSGALAFGPAIEATVQ
jgi:hypothetical protein